MIHFWHIVWWLVSYHFSLIEIYRRKRWADHLRLLKASCCPRIFRQTRMIKGSLGENFWVSNDLVSSFITSIITLHHINNTSPRSLKNLNQYIPSIVASHTHLQWVTWLHHFNTSPQYIAVPPYSHCLTPWISIEHHIIQTWAPAKAWCLYVWVPGIDGLLGGMMGAVDSRPLGPADVAGTMGWWDGHWSIFS